MHAVREVNPQQDTLTEEEVEAFAQRNGYTVRPMAQQDNYRCPEGPRRDSYRRQDESRQATYNNQPSTWDKSRVLCWHCGKYGHFSRECNGKEKTYRFAPPREVRPPRNIGINHIDTEEWESSSNHSSVAPIRDVKA